MIANLIARASKKIKEQRAQKEKEAKIKAIKDRNILFERNGLLIKAVPAFYPRGSKDILIISDEKYTVNYPQFKNKWNLKNGEFAFNNLSTFLLLAIPKKDLISVSIKNGYVHTLIRGLTKTSQGIRATIEHEKQKAAA